MEGSFDLRLLKPYQTKGFPAVAAKAQAEALARSPSGVPQRRGRSNSGPSRPAEPEPEPGGHGRHLAGTAAAPPPSLPRLSAGTSGDGNLQQYKKHTATVELKFPRGFFRSQTTPKAVCSETEALLLRCKVFIHAHLLTKLF